MLIAIVGIAAIGGSSAHATNTLCVSTTGNDTTAPLGSGCYATVQAAINHTSNGDTIDIGAGTFIETGHVTINGKTGLSIVGAGSASTTIDTNVGCPGCGSASNTYGVFIENSSQITLQGMTVIGPNAINSGGGATTGPSRAIHGTGYGIHVDGTDHTSFVDVTVKNSARSNFDFNGSSFVTLTNVGAMNAAYGNGLNFSDTNNVTINGVTTSGNAWGGIALYATGTFHPCGVANVTIANANLGEPGALYTGIDNTSGNGSACTVSNLTVPTSTLPYDVTVNQGSVGDPRDIYVSSLATASAVAAGSTSTPVVRSTVDGALLAGNGFDAQAALNAAPSNGTVAFAAGTYGALTVNTSGLTLSGAGGSLSIVSGSGGNGLTLGAGATGTTIRNLGVHGFAGGVDISTSGVTLSGDTITGNTNGVVVENGVTGVAVHGSDLSGNSAAPLRDNRTSRADQIQAGSNWFGSAGGPGTIAGVVVIPWCLTASCASLSNTASLSSLSLAGVTLSPGFSAGTTSYTANVDSSTSGVTVSDTAAPGATATVAGASNLTVGNNAVTITVTSADASVSRVYTVNVTRATPPPAPVTTTIPTPTTTTTPAPPVVNQPQSAPATPGTSGSVAVTVAPQAPKPAAPGAVVAASVVPIAPPVSIALSWPPNAFTVPVTVQVTPQPQAAVPVGATAPAPTPVSGGFTVGNTVIQVNVTTDSGAAVTQFSAPLVIHVSSLPAGQFPAYSHDGKTWTTIPRLATPDLPFDQQDGYFVNPDGSIDISTRHATLFGLLIDSEIPSTPVVAARITGSKLRLTIKAKDNVRVTSYRLLVNGHLLRRTKHAYLVLTSRTGEFQIVAVDGAGNLSTRSVSVVVQASPSGRGFTIS